MLPGAGVAADDAYEAEAARGFALLLGLRLLGLLLGLRGLLGPLVTWVAGMLGLPWRWLLVVVVGRRQEVRVPVLEGREVGRARQREVRRQAAAQRHRALLHRAGTVRIVARRRPARTAQRAVTLR